MAATLLSVWTADSVLRNQPIIIERPSKLPTIIAAPPHKLDERFVVSWPTALKMAVPEIVVVRIAANDYEDLLADIESGRKVKTERFKGEARLEVSLTPDSGIEVVKQHSETQVVTKGQRHREWSWSVWPKTTGPHELSLLVQGVSGNNREDYDPQVMHYDVEFNFGYWLSNGLQQNGISWIWAVILLAITNTLTFWLSKRSSKRGLSE